jgi:putative flippase GtrA
LISVSQVTEGSTLSVFKGAAFLVAASHSYFWNKTWVFQSQGNAKPAEIGKFLTVNLASLLINTLVFSLVYAAGNTESLLEATRWANVAAVAGSASALVFTFVGLKLLVFRR